MKWERSWAVLGAAILCTALFASPARAQQKYRITQPNFKPSTAQLINGNKTLVIDGPLGRFIYQYDAERSGAERALVYDLTKAPNGVNAPGMLKWPQRGNGPLLMRQEAQDDRGFVWVKIGDVRPIVATKPKPPTQRFSPRTWQAHNAAILDLDIGASGRFLASGDARGVKKRWAMSNYQPQGTWNPPGTSVAFRRGGGIAAGGPSAVQVLRANTTTQAAGAPPRVQAVGYRWDGELLAAGGMFVPAARRLAGVVQLWHDDGRTLHPMRRLPGIANSPYRSVAFGPNNRFLFAAGGAGEDENLGTVTRWNLANYEAVHIARFQGVAYSVATAARGGSRELVLAIGGVRIERGRKVGFITLMTNDDTKTESQEGAVYSVDLSRDGTQLAAGCGKSVLFWTGNQNEPTRLPTKGVVRSVAFAPNGSKLAAGDMNGRITVWTIGSARRMPSVLPTYRVQIKVVDGKTAKPITDAQVVPKRGGAGFCNKLRWSRPAGNHRFEASAPGRYTFEVRHKDFPAKSVQYAIGPKELLQVVRLNRAVVPPKPDPTPQPTKATVLLRVQNPDGTPVESPKIQLIAGPGRVTPRGEQPRGTHRFEATKAGQYRFDVSKQGYSSQMVTARADGQPKTVTLHRGFKLLLTVLDADKQPVADPKILIDGPGRETGARKRDSRGTHTLSLTTNGIYKVTVRKQGFKEQILNVDVRDSGTRRTITLTSGLELAIAVVDVDFKTIDRPTIEITPPGKATKVSTNDAVHTYSFRSSGRYQFKVSKEGFVTQTKTFDLSTGSGKNTFKLKAIEYELVVRVPSGGEVAVFAPQGSVVTRRIDAAYSLWLSPGTYKLSYTNDDEFTFEKQVTIRSGNAELKFEPDPFPTARRLHRKLDSNGDKKLTKEDIASGWDELWDRNGDGEIEVKEIAAELKKPVQDGDQPSTMTPLPAKSRSDAVRRKLDSLPTSESGWAKTDVDPQTWEFFKELDTNGDEVIDTTEQKRFTDAMDKEAIADSVNDSDATTVPAALVSLRNRLRKLDRKRDGLDRTDVPSDAWLWLFRNFDKNKDDKLDATEELKFLTEFRSVVTEHVKQKALIEVLRPLFHKRDKHGNGLDDWEVDTQEWKVLAAFDIAPKNGRIDRNSEETAFLKAYEIKLKELFQLLIEADRRPPAPPPSDKAAQLRARLKRMDTKKPDGLDTGEVDADTWTTLFARYDTNKNDRLDPTEVDALVEEWKPWVEDPVDEPVAVKRRVLKVRKIQGR